VNRRPGLAGAFAERAAPRVRAGVNAYLDEHRAFGPELVPAEDAPAWRGRWRERLGLDGPLHVELGIGNGEPLAARAVMAPVVPWIGIEIRFKRCVVAARKLRRAGAKHAAVVRYSWFSLGEVLADGEAQVIQLDHPDPWPKEKQAKHRLIDEAFARGVERWLAPGGELRLKTDFLPHVEALALVVVGTALKVIGRSDDVAREGVPWGETYVTPYEQKARRGGKRVYALWVKR
jgi:tRNA (guanine-N7-)-methyltransferase